MRFRTTLLQGGKTATGIEVSAEAVAALGSGKRPPVRITINGYTYRSTVAVMGGKFMVGVSADVRRAAGVAGGDEVDIELELDTAAREVAVPPELGTALDRNPDAKRAFAALSNSKKQRHTLPIEKAKTAETKQRNVDKAIAELAKG
jgi:predicted thioesterase